MYGNICGNVPNQHKILVGLIQLKRHQCIYVAHIFLTLVVESYLRY